MGYWRSCCFISISGVIYITAKASDGAEVCG